MPTYAFNLPGRAHHGGALGEPPRLNDTQGGERPSVGKDSSTPSKKTAGNNAASPGNDRRAAPAAAVNSSPTKGAHGADSTAGNADMGGDLR